MGINTGAGKRWERKALTLDIQEKLIRGIIQKYYSCIDILLLGGKGELSRNNYLQSLFSDKIINTGNNNNLREFCSIIYHCDMVITSDSLAMHIGTALNKYIIAFFGPTSADEIELFENGGKIITDLPCQCCYLSKCDVSPACNEIDYSEKIIELIYSYLEQLNLKE